VELDARGPAATTARRRGPGRPRRRRSGGRVRVRPLRGAPGARAHPAGGDAARSEARWLTARSPRRWLGALLMAVSKEEQSLFLRWVNADEAVIDLAALAQRD
jgi:hypothetical protein